MAMITTKELYNHSFKNLLMCVFIKWLVDEHYIKPIKVTMILGWL